MYRVLLKVDSVRMRIREAVELQIVVRKDHRHFTHCRGEPLRNGEAKPTNSSEFLIDANTPRFELELYLTVGETRKRGGTVLINLKNYVINAAHRITAPIKKTPLTDSTLCVDFSYMKSELSGNEEGLISLQHAEEQQHRHHLKQITDQHQKLVFHNNRLNQEIVKLKQKHLDLSNQRRSLQLSISQREEEYSEEILEMEREKEKSRLNLQNEKQKIAEIVQKITQSGDNSLMRQMDRVISAPSSN